MRYKLLEKMPFLPVVIIGAARSGTNVLRDVLTRVQGFSTWPCDEINPIWRHGNLDLAHDEIPVERVTTSIRRSIRKAFFKIWEKANRPPYVVEKTCANSLRVPFVNAVLPEARYVYIKRNSHDVVASACKRWRGELEVPMLQYYFSKARYTPPGDLFRYGSHALLNRIKLCVKNQNHFDTWGPCWSGMKDLKNISLEELVAMQWSLCVTKSEAAFKEIEKSRVYWMTYEDFVEEPAGVLDGVLRWLGESRECSTINEAVSIVRRQSTRERANKAKNLLSNPKKVSYKPEDKAQMCSGGDC